MLFKTDVLKNFVKFTEKQLCQGILFNKVANVRPTTLLKKETFALMVSCEICKVFKNFFSLRTSPIVASAQLYRIWITQRHSSKIFTVGSRIVVMCNSPFQNNPFMLSMGLAIFWNSHFSEQLFSVTVTYRSSHQRCFLNKAVLNNSAILTGNHLSWGLFLIKF